MVIPTCLELDLEKHGQIVLSADHLCPAAFSRTLDYTHTPPSTELIATDQEWRRRRKYLPSEPAWRPFLGFPVSGEAEPAAGRTQLGACGISPQTAFPAHGLPEPVQRVMASTSASPTLKPRSQEDEQPGVRAGTHPGGEGGREGIRGKDQKDHVGDTLGKGGQVRLVGYGYQLKVLPSCSSPRDVSAPYLSQKIHVGEQNEGKVGLRQRGNSK